MNPATANARNHDLAPLLTATRMLRERLDDEVIDNYLRRTFDLDEIDARAAIAAARIIARY